MFLKKSNSSAIEVLKKHEQMLFNESMTNIRELGLVSKELHEDWEIKIYEKASFIADIGKGREQLLKVIKELSSRSSHKKVVAGRRYQISSIFLKECREYLCSDPGRNERLHLVTGPITADAVRVLSRMEKVKYQNQSSAYVSADDIDAHMRIISLAEDYGHLLLAMFHSHMSHGVATTAPSTVDISFMERMGKLGIDCIGGIFSLDGYVRFFSKKRFELEIYGKGAKQVQDRPSEKIFKIIRNGDSDESKDIQNKTSK